MNRVFSLMLVLALAVVMGGCSAPVATPTSAPTATPAAPATVAPSPSTVSAESTPTLAAPTATLVEPTAYPQEPTAYPQQPTAQPQSTVASAAEASSPTAGQLAEQGKAVYASACGRCHGAQGQGGGASPLTGAAQKLAKYEDAQQLLQYISKTMPRGAPGSLSEEEYLQVVAFLLLQNEMVQADTAIAADALANIQVR